MKIIELPIKIEGLIFDIDLTLYGSKEYYKSQIELLIGELAKESGKPNDLALSEIEEFRKSYSELHGGRKPSLGQIFLHYGISIEKNCEWRTRLFRPEAYLSRDSRLVETLTVLASAFRLGAVTNNTTPIAERTLDVLGVRDLIPVLVGLDRSKAVKPSMVPFDIASKEMGLSFDKLVSIGDRMEVDIELPVQNGMGGILVDGMDDVYELLGVLL